MAENVRVGVRLRPLNARELAGAADAGNPATARKPRALAWEADAAQHTVASLPAAATRNHVFNYDYVFEPTATNEDLYDELAKPVVEAALAGYNGTVFAYGQTSSGKTHSMVGSPGDLGVTPRALQHIMRVANEKAGGRRYLVRVTYCEIYNEIIRDLMNLEAGEIKVREDANGKTFMRAEEVVVQNVQEAMAVLKRGQERRSVGETAMNRESSRSHTIFTLIIESRGEALGSEKCLRSSTLHLVDLAGSERAKSTHAAGARLREGSHINKSLLTLGTIINKLSSGDGAHIHLPYRDSNLTRVLRDALGGNSRTSVLCAITPSPLHVEETLSTLKFAERAKNVTNSAVRNEVIDYKAKYLEAVAELKVLRASIPNGLASPPPSPGATDENQPPVAVEEPEDKARAVSTSSDGDPVALMMELERAREDISYLKERAETAELDSSHYLDKLKTKADDVRSLRSELAQMKDKVLDISGKQETLQLSIAQAYFRLESMRQAAKQTRKRGSALALNEDELESVLLKLAMFIPDEEFSKRKVDVAAPGLVSSNSSKIVNVSQGAWPVTRPAKGPGDAGRAPVRRHSENTDTRQVARRGLPPRLESSPVSPENGPIGDTLREIYRAGPAAAAATSIGLFRNGLFGGDGAGSGQPGRVGNVTRKEDTTQAKADRKRPPSQNGIPGGDASEPKTVPEKNDCIPVLDFDDCDQIVECDQIVDSPEESDDSDASSRRTLRKRKSKALQAMRSFYGGSSNLQDKFSGGHKVSSS